jgi:hypothetical protein
VAIEQEPRHHLVLANEFVRGFAVEIAPHVRTLCHHHAHSYLMYVAGAAQIVSAPRDGTPKTHSYRDGDCELSPAGLVHVVENLTDAKFRNLLVELLPGIGDVRRGADPKIVSGEATIIQRFADKCVSVFLLKMESGSQVEIYGPAVVASPYENEVQLVASGTIARIVKRFADLSWLGPSTAATMRNSAGPPAKVVLIAVGER